MLKMNSIKLVLFVPYMYGLMHATAAADCEAGQVAHTVVGRSVCCVPAFNCPLNTEYVPCTMDGGRDQCVNCGPGAVNGHMTSWDNWDHYRCVNYTNKHLKHCSSTEHVPLNDAERINQENCPVPCECDVSKCYYGNACSCILREKCEVNEQLNRITGDCETCMENLQYTLGKGCGPCLWNETAWRMSQNISTDGTEVTRTIQVKENPSTQKPVLILDNNLPSTIRSGYNVITDAAKSPNSSTSANTAGDANELPISAVVIVMVVLVAIGVIVAILLVIRRKVKQGNTDSRLVACYTRLTGKKKDKEAVPTQDPESQQQEEITNGRPSQAVSPMRRDGAVESDRAEEGEPLFVDMSLAVDVNSSSSAPLTQESGEQETNPKTS